MDYKSLECCKKCKHAFGERYCDAEKTPCVCEEKCDQFEEKETK